MKFALASLAALLLAVLALQWHGWDASGSPPSAPPANGAMAEAPGPLPDAADLLTPPPPPEEYASVSERPLFLPDRRPPPDAATGASEQPAAESAPADDSEIKGLALSAVLITGDTRIAWVRLPREPKLRRLRPERPEEWLGGWSVAAIEADRLVLRQGDTERHIPLHDYSQHQPQPLIPLPIPPARAVPPPPAVSNAADGPEEESPPAREQRTHTVGQ